MHWPSSSDPADPTLKTQYKDWNFIDTWREMQKLPASGRVKNIGISNFGVTYLNKLLSDPSCKIKPAVNQIELHPNNPTNKLLAECKKHGIHATAYSCMGSTDSPLYKNPAIIKLAESKGKTVQQVL